MTATSDDSSPADPVTAVQKTADKAPVNAETPQQSAAPAGEGGDRQHTCGDLDGGVEHPGRGRRRKRRDRHRARGRTDGLGQSPGEQPQDEMQQAALLAASERVGELFAQVLSGEFDGEEPPAEDCTETDTAPKRVLAPEPEAPKLQKVLGQAGVGSRRDMEELIVEGRITVNGQPAHVGQRISWGDQVQVDGKAIKYRIAQPLPRILAYHKPVGEIVTHDDPQERPTVFRGLPRLQQGKWQSVGRLDINTEGLLLFTNSGELANQLMHPRFGIEREYAVRVLGTLDQAAKQTLLQGVSIEGQSASFKSIEDGGGEGANHWYRVVITEGRNREVRKLFDAVGLTVSRLIRVRYGSVALPRGLKRSVWIDLDDTDVRRIRQLANPRAVDAGLAERTRGRQANGRGDPQSRREQGRRGERPPAASAQNSGIENDEGLDFDPMRIPNPLEQTFDKSFVKNPRGASGWKGLAQGGCGFGAGGSAPNPAPTKRGNGSREPDPLQTSVGYIGADAVYRKRGRGGPQGSSGGGHRNSGGNRGGGRGGQRSR